MTTKNYFKTPLLLITIATLSSCSNNSDWNKFRLNGKVKTYLEKKYKAEKKFGEWQNGDIEYSGHNRVFFDSDGSYQWTECLDKDNKLLAKFVSRKENCKIIEESYYGQDGKLISKKNFTHKSKDEVEFITFNEGGEKTSQGKLYLANNRIVKTEYQTFEKDKVKKEYSVFFEYNKDGRLASQKQTDKKAKTTYFLRFKYIEFDKNNNWTKQLNYDSEEGEEPKNIVIREYEYY